MVVGSSPTGRADVSFFLFTFIPFFLIYVFITILSAYQVYEIGSEMSGNCYPMRWQSVSALASNVHASAC